MKIISLIAASAVALLSLASPTYASTPIQGTPVGLEHDPEGIAVPGGKTDAKGNASFTGLKTARYTVFLPDLSKFKGPVIIAVSVNGAAPVTSEAMKPGKGKGYAMDKAGRKLVFTVDKPGAPFVVTVSDR